MLKYFPTPDLPYYLFIIHNLIYRSLLFVYNSQSYLQVTVLARCSPGVIPPCRAISQIWILWSKGFWFIEEGFCLLYWVLLFSLPVLLILSMFILLRVLPEFVTSCEVGFNISARVFWKGSRVLKELKFPVGSRDTLFRF